MNKFFKITFIFILLTLGSPSDAILPENEVSVFSLIEKKGTTYQISSKIPFTGIAVHYRRNGQLDYKKRFINGKLNGDTQYFHFNGELGLKEK
jgi:antitoxin component YwqK of YwqJK toxin-antitoxin module